MISEKSGFKEKFLLYMDILGTKNLIETQPDLLLDIIKNIALNNRKGEIINKPGNDGYLDNIKYESEFSSFSDHMVVSHYCDTDLALSSLIIVAIQIHSFLLAQGILARGSITKGLLHHDGNIVLGKALNRAVYLEEESCFPRVIIDDDIIDVFESHISSGSIIQDKRDNKYFVSYIEYPIRMTSSEQEVIFISENLKKIIENNVYDINLNDKAKAKWIWLEEELNRFLINPKKTPETNKLQSESGAKN